jgi:cytochrome c-type biogenesis protein CcsB
VIRTVTFLLFVLLIQPVFAIQVPSNLDFEALRTIPVLDNGRHKPFDTFAGESIRKITGKWKYEGNSPSALVLSMLTSHDWLHEQCIRIDYMPLKEALGFDVNQQFFNYHAITDNPHFRELANRTFQKHSSQQELNPLETEMGELIHKLNLLHALITGEAVKIVPPPPGSPDEADWLPIADPQGYSAETQTELRNMFSTVTAAFTTADNAQFQQAVQNLKAKLSTLNPEAYQYAHHLELEIFYNDSRPFLYSWVLYLIAFLIFLTWYSFPNKPLWWSGYGFAIAGFLLHSYGLIVRAIISGRAPVSNMYESVIWVGWGIVATAIIFDLLYRRHWFMTTASALGVGFLILADILPFDPNIEPLVPVLRSNYWLIIHVLTITLSYSIFALGMALAHVILAIYFYMPKRRDLLSELSLFLYRIIQVGVVFLFAGTVLGGVWAAESWGRFWGWDPKETWALISLIGYLAILHARYTGWMRDFGTAVCSILGFWLILMTWYGVNFVLAVGLHSYGFGSGGGTYVMGYLLAEVLFLTGVALKYKTMNATVNAAINADETESLA